MDGNAHVGTSATVLSTGNWYHLAVTSDGAKTKLYINGQFDSETANSGVLPGTGSVSIGAAANGSQSWHGLIDEARIYDRALSPGEITDLYRWSPPPVLYFDFNEGPGNVSVYDKSGNDNTGTLNGNIPKDSWTLGQFGWGLTFDGINDTVTVANTVTNIRTVSFWVNPTTTTQPLLTLASGKYVSASGGTVSATGFDTPTVYVDGIKDKALTANAWHHVTVTTPTGITGDAIAVGLANSAYLKGVIDELIFYDYVRQPGEMVSDMNAGHPAPGSPVGSAALHLTFDEGYGDTAHNTGSGGTVINGNLGGATACPQSGSSSCPIWTNQGQLAKALNFDGTDDYAVINDNVSIEPTDTFTLSTWFFADNLTKTAGDYTKGQILARKTGNYILYIYDETETQLNLDFYVYGPNQRLSYPASNLANSRWYHVVATYDGTLMSLYIDGNLVKTHVASGNITTSANNLNLGADESDIADTAFDGMLDDLKIYNFALTPDQVKVEYNQGQAVVFGGSSTTSTGTSDNSAARAYCVPGDSATCNPPVAEWLLDEYTGTAANDTSGNANTGTLTGGPTWEHSGVCRYNSCAAFDGTDDFIDVGTGPGTVKTVAFWVNPVTTTQYPLDLNGSAYVWFNAGTVTAESFTSPTIYVNGLPGTTITANKWNFVTITTGTGLNASDFDLGRVEGVGTFTGKLDTVILYDYVRTPAQIAWDYNHGAPTAHYNFDDCRGTSLHDIAPKADPSLSSLNGTLDAGAAGQTAAGDCGTSTDTMWYNGRLGKFGGALNFDGTDDYAATGNTALLAANTATYTNVSYGGWVKPATSPTSDTLLHKGNEFRLTTDASGKPQCELYSGSWQPPITGPAPLPVDTWTHLLCTYDGTNLKLYVNGNLTQSLPQATTVTATNTTPLSLARDPGGSGYFDGLLDEVQIYAYPLTPTQVKTAFTGAAIKFGK